MESEPTVANPFCTFMHRCLHLARIGLGEVAPNPMVGAVIVHQGRIIGEGWHRAFGGPHAEVEAIQAVIDKTLLPESTLYVNLEPCSHHGKTPPCADLILHHGIRKVVVAQLDPNPLVAGRGIEKLKAAGVDVQVGLMEQEARWLNRRFNIYHQQKRPYIILKWAETADGFVDQIRAEAPGPLKITCPAMDVVNHLYRSREAAIMVGTNTALMDNPALTVRHVPGQQPVRVLVDADLRVPTTAKLFAKEGRVLIINRKKEGQEENRTYLKVDAMNPHLMTEALFNAEIQSVIIEGGPTMQRSFLEAGLWDEAWRIVAPMRIGAGIAAPLLSGIAHQETPVGVDRLMTYYHPRLSA